MDRQQLLLSVWTWDKYGFELESCVENSEYEVTSISITDRCYN